MKGKIVLKPEQEILVRTATFSTCQRDESGYVIYHFMGTGKSLTALAVAANFAKTINKIYVVCPAPIRFVWKREIEKWQPPMTPIVWSFEDFYQSDANVVNACVILDEIQNVMLSPGSAQILMKFSTARVRLALSGTPADSLGGFLRLLRSVAPTKFEQSHQETLKRFTKVNHFWRAARVANHYFPKLLITLSPLLALRKTPMFFEIGKGHVMAGFALYLFMALTELVPPSAQWDVPAIAKAAAPIVSFKGDPGVLQTDDTFPTKKIQVIYVPLTTHQLNLFDEWVAQTIDPQILVDLGVVESVQEIGFKNPDERASVEVILDRGRGIAMCGRNPSKLKKLKKILSRKAKIMIYTSFAGNVGLNALKKMLDKEGRKYEIVSAQNTQEENELAVERYNTMKSDVMLNCGLNEGMSLVATRVVVFLEPPKTSSVFEQVVARARRADSHTHLPLNERNVHVYVLVGHFHEKTALQAQTEQILDYLSNSLTGSLAAVRYAKEMELQKTQGLPPEKAAEQTHSLFTSFLGNMPFARVVGLTSALRLASALVAPRNSARNVMRWVRNAFGSKQAAIAAVELSKGVNFDSSAGTPEDFAWRRIERGTKELDALSSILQLNNIQSVKTVIGTPECKDECVIWPLSQNSSASSCAERSLPRK